MRSLTAVVKHLRYYTNQKKKTEAPHSFICFTFTLDAHSLSKHRTIIMDARIRGTELTEAMAQLALNCNIESAQQDQEPGRSNESERSEVRVGRCL